LLTRRRPSRCESDQHLRALGVVRGGGGLPCRWSGRRPERRNPVSVGVGVRDRRRTIAVRLTGALHPSGADGSAARWSDTPPAEGTHVRSPIFDYLDDVLADTAGIDSGELADYIPELASVDPNRAAVALCTV